MIKIAIDAGHGPNTQGKRCPDDSMREYHFNSVTARYIAAALVEYDGVEVRTSTFNDNEDVPINTRYKTANTWPADLFVSVHANAHGDSWNSANGIETLVDYRKPAQAVALANAVQRELIRATGLRDRGLQYRDDVGVLNYSNMTAILVECGFMTNREEAELLKSDAYRRKCAGAIVKGIVEFYGLKKKKGEEPDMSGQFKDVPAGHWAAGAISTAVDAGIIKGYADGTFKPEQPVTRAELAVIISRLLTK
ncbi:N-acetylmuramoyl-L-alanine amidase [Paenibacillus sp. GCM10012307]|uniref:N-acetylmuramoyl-L-alanine amidase n=1 Tax=Paenibacillus roseus TaxID=2798579 RepID=A0A934MPH4_9BACL|nr:N-acetylmuramoyl-L-alanine amidase [Paenibacillus roseus]MBJ6362081.1 N-acetylmuramoyl-L-alanine amidase [Paenibacillus roseus]